MARYALVIGISEYQSPRLGNLQKPVADAEAVAQILEQYGDFLSVKRFPVRWKDQNSAELATKKVTGVELGRELKTFLQEQAAHHEALIYFSGHGFTVYDNLDQQKGYLAASDCQVEVGENHQVSEQRYGISLDSLNELIRDSQLSSLVVLLDCCHSGYFLERQLIKQTLTAFSSQKDYYLITACRSYEDALAVKTEENSIFTNVVLKGLAPENASRNRRVSGDRLFDYVSSELKAVFQEPIRMGWGRSITLVTYPQLKLTPNGEKEFNQENPYRGLYSFESEQAKYFFGREQAIRALLDRINNNRFLAVIGASGCGKSSLVKAGLLAYLKDNQIPGSSHWEIESFTPGKHPLAKLIEILDRQHKQNQPFVIFIDQLEEIFTLCEDDAERQSFIHLMAEEVTNSDRLTRIIVTIRTDFLDRCAAYSEAATLINRSHPTTYVVTPLSRPELEEAIKEPATLHGVKFQQGLITQIADDVDDQPGALPLLQYALKELWRVCIEKPEIPEKYLTWKGYKEIGGVKGALENRANLLYQSFSSSDQLFVHRMFMELVQLSDENQVTRRRTIFERLEAIADSIEQLRRVVQLLADQRLIVTDKDTVEVAHEALLTEWNLLRGWIEEDRENIRLSRLLETECHEWQVRFKKSDEALLTGAKLATIAEWKEKTEPKLLVEEAEFLQKSLAKRDREIQEELERIELELDQERKLRELAASRQKEAEQKTKIAIGAICGLTLLAASTLGFAWQAEQRKNTAIAALISEPRRLLDTDNQLEALIASVKALKQLQEIGGRHEQALKELISVLSQVRERNRLEGHTGGVNSINLSPNSKDNLIASASSDRIIKLWKTNGTLWKSLTGHSGKIWTVSFSPDGQYIASGSEDQTIIIWRNNGSRVKTLSGHTGQVYHLSFSPDGNTIASAGYDKTVRLWKWKESSNPFKTLTQHQKEVYSVTFSPDGNFIASTSADKTIKLWTANGTYLKTLRRHPDEVRFASFGIDGRSLVYISDDRTLRILRWNHSLTDTKNNYISSRIIAKDNDRAQVVYFTPKGEIASTNIDGRIRFWKIDGTILPALVGHKGQINDLSFSRDGKTVVSAGRDGTVRIWSIDYIPVNNTQTLSNTDHLIGVTCNWLENYLNNNTNAKKSYKDVCTKM